MRVYLDEFHGVLVELGLERAVVQERFHYRFLRRPP